MGCCSGPAKGARASLLFATVLLAIGSLVMLSVSAAALADDPRPSQLMGMTLARGPALLLTATASLSLLLALVGCCGALCRSLCLVGLFATVSLLLLLLSIAGFIAAMMLVGPSAPAAEQAMLESMARYGNDTQVTKLWDFVQRDFHCCGVLNGGDWERNSSISAKVPVSCCRVYDNGTRADCDQQPTAANSYTATGCLSSVLHAVGDHQAAFGGAAFAVGFFLATASLLACLFIRRQRQAAYERLTV